MNNPLLSRSISGFTLSVATGLAMESIFTPRQETIDPDRVAPVRIPLRSYNELWVNVMTLVRNAYNACDKQVLGHIRPEHMTECIHQEIELITELLKIEGQDTVKPVFFVNDYRTVIGAGDIITKLRKDTTALQKQTRHIANTSINFLLRQEPSLRSFKGTLMNPGGKNVLMLTHIPYDLLSHRNFANLDLLESHTGKLKTKSEWNSKYYPFPDMDMGRLPFCRQLLAVFGDKVMFSPNSIKIRKEVADIAKQSRWNPSTSAHRVQTDLLRMKDIALSEAIRKVSVY